MSTDFITVCLWVLFLKIIENPTWVYGGCTETTLSVSRSRWVFVGWPLERIDLSPSFVFLWLWSFIYTDKSWDGNTVYFYRTKKNFTFSQHRGWPLLMRITSHTGALTQNVHSVISYQPLTIKGVSLRGFRKWVSKKKKFVYKGFSNYRRKVWVFLSLV